MTAKEFEQRLQEIRVELFALASEARRYVHLDCYGNVYVKGTETASRSYRDRDMGGIYTETGDDYAFPGK